MDNKIQYGSSDAKQQYLQDRFRWNARNAADKKLKHAVEQFTPHIVRTNYVKNFTWMGIPIIQYPSDVMVIQELICELRPDYIIETGTAFGGSALFYASLMHTWGSVLTIDIEFREHTTKALNTNPIIRMIQGSSVDPNVYQRVYNILKNQFALVILDSNHTHEHVYKELQLYSKFVNVSSYIIVMDTAIEFYGHLDKNQDRPWGKENNPWTAVQKFISEQDNFVIDKDIERRSLITGAIDGWLKRIK